MPRIASAVSRISESLGRDLSYARKGEVPATDRARLIVEKYKGRARGALGRGPVQPFSFGGKVVHAESSSDAALLQRVVTENHDVLDRFGLLGASGIVAVDVGAHNGETALAWDLWLDHPTIHSFEANPVSAATAAKNLADVPNATVHATGLGRERATMPFDVHSAGGDASFIFDASSATETIEVPIVPGDELLSGLSPDLMKIDVEGFEWNVIQGLRDTLARTRFLAIEMSLGRPKDHEYFEIAGLLAELRFELVDASPPHLGPGGEPTAIDLYYRRVADEA